MSQSLNVEQKVEEQAVVPTLSVTVLNYNYGHFLPTCLDSILSQDYKDFEIILINDKSTDNSLEIIQPYLKDTRIRLIDHQVNKGFVGSLIEGVELSRAPYITVISADDWVLQPDAFSQQMAVMESDHDIALVYTAYAHYNKENKAFSVWRAGDKSFIHSREEAFKELVIKPSLLHSGTIIRTSAYYQAGGYDPDFRYAVDTKMWLSLCHTGKAAYINEILYAYRRHDTNMSKNLNSLSKSYAEGLAAIDWSFGKLPTAKRKELAKLRIKGEQNVLVGFALDDIFGSHYRSGWINYWVAFKTHPTRTLLQKVTLILILRTILGARGYSGLENLKARFSHRTRNRLTADSANQEKI